MAILYVTEQGATIRHLAGRIVVRRENRIITELPDFKVEQIVIYGNAEMTSGARNYCFEQGIDVAYLSTTGRYRGRMENRLARNAVLRQRQQACVSDPEFCRRNAAAIVSGKIRNMAAMIRQQRRLRTDGRPLLAELEALLPRVAGARDLEALNGYEGTATATYFKAFRAALRGGWKFEARQYHPPADPVNALLSFGYTLLHNDVFAAINIVGLDPYSGTFHRPRQGHAALASDLQEELRAIVTDRLVLTALNKRIIVETDFVLTPDGRFRLAQEALKRFLAMYARQISETVLYPAQGIRTSYRQVIELQARQFARVVMGEEEVYRPFQPSEQGWATDREEA
ncbi:MAG: CRISPR-associated endonuclease Cas1 [Blastocatellia bacterium]